MSPALPVRVGRETGRVPHVLVPPGPTRRRLLRCGIRGEGAELPAHLRVPRKLWIARVDDVATQKRLPALIAVKDLQDTSAALTGVRRTGVEAPELSVLA